MKEEHQNHAQDDRPDRWMLIRDVAVFQVKLLFDGFRDLLLLPVSLIAGLLSLVKGGPRPSPEFYDLLRMGRRSERWINLFGAASHLHGPPTEEDPFPVDDVDDMVARMESFVVEEYRRGGLTAQAKERVDKALDLIQRRGRRHRNSEDPG
jgi:hypothetical protein